MKRTPVLYLSQYLVHGAPPKNGRGLTKRPFPYTGDLPLSLHNQVVGKGSSSEGASCLYEVANLLACLKENDFAEKFCVKESTVLRSCHEKTLAEMKKRKAQEQEGTLVPGAKSLSSYQINALLKKYPQPGVK